MSSAFKTVALVGRYQSDGVAGTLADILIGYTSFFRGNYRRILELSRAAP